MAAVAQSKKVISSKDELVEAFEKSPAPTFHLIFMREAGGPYLQKETKGKFLLDSFEGTLIHRITNQMNQLKTCFAKATQVTHELALEGSILWIKIKFIPVESSQDYKGSQETHQDRCKRLLKTNSTIRDLVKGIFVDVKSIFRFEKTSFQYFSIQDLDLAYGNKDVALISDKKGRFPL